MYLASQGGTSVARMCGGRATFLNTKLSTNVDTPGHNELVAANEVLSEFSAKHQDRGKPKFDATFNLFTLRTTNLKGARGHWRVKVAALSIFASSSSSGLEELILHNTKVIFDFVAQTLSKSSEFNNDPMK